jgi:hypothetical protein
LKVSLENPPDRIFTGEYCRAWVRSLLVGYDENLPADGRVIGSAANEQYQMYNESEKKKFQEMHRTQVIGKRQEIERLLSEGTSATESRTNRSSGSAQA